MKALFRTAFSQGQHRSLVFLSIFSMILLTLASQLEIITLGIITHYQQGKSGFIGQILDTINDWLPLTENIRFFALFIIFVALFKAIAIFCQRYFTKLVAIRISQELRQSYFEHLQLLPMRFYHDYSMGSLASRAVGDASLIAEAINAMLINYLQTPFTVGSTLILCFINSPRLTFLLLACLPTIVFPIVFLAKRVRRLSKRVQKSQEVFTSVLLDFLGGIETIKSFVMEPFSLKKYQEQNDSMAVLEQKSARYDLSSRPVIHTLGMFFLALALLYGLYGLEMNLADIFVYCGLLYVFYEPIKKFAEENSRIQRGLAAADRMHEVLNIQPETSGGTATLKGFQEEIVFDDVWFRYGEEWVLKGLSFKIKKGEKVAIVGPTGSGKSTLAQLLPVLYLIQKGEIRIDGQSIYRYTENSLREAIAFVPQKPFLFLDTVKANIAFGRPFSDEEIVAAAHAAHAHEFIERLPEGYDSLLLERGKNLSGGQQQRLSIARALIKKAPILLLDEATSSLDTVSESLIKETLRQLRGSVTQILIAHRLSTIEDADRIIVLDKGEIVAQGTLQELLSSSELFRKLYQ